MTLRDNLGQMASQSTDPRAIVPMLTRHEAGELIRRAALAAGLFPLANFTAIPRSNHRRLDWVWVTPAAHASPGRIVAAFQIDGAGPSLRTVADALEYLGALVVPSIWHVRFHLTGALNLRGSPSHFDERAEDLRQLGIDLQTDLDVMAEGGIETLIASVLSKQATWRRWPERSHFEQHPLADRAARLAASR